jgi:metallophosphoesterase (TIGR00282 family)
MKNLKILALGDVVGNAALELVISELGKLRSETQADIVIVNAENASGIHGITPAGAEALYMAGADVITGGNHTFYPKGIGTALDDNEYLLRPANLPRTIPGKGYTIVDLGFCRVLVMNLLGRVGMDACDSPFESAEKVLKINVGKYDIAVCDFHAEATSEKAALARYFDGRIHVVFGTHTHVQTNDARILKNGTGFISDLGMCGPDDSILGVKSEIIINKFLTSLPARFEVADGEIKLCGAIFDVNIDKKITQNVLNYIKI